MPVIPEMRAGDTPADFPRAITNSPLVERILQKRYRVVRALGRGGRGAVWLCDDLRLQGKQWALKTVRTPEAADRDLFVREAETLSRLRHPNLPLVVDFFEEEGEMCLVMEYVDGENLSEATRRAGLLQERVAFAHGLTMAEILVYLHGHTPPIVFRDLKPDNVMLASDGVLKLVDFGLARRVDPGQQSDTRPSGSVGYAAPEQWEDTAESDVRSDLYSWGATVLHLVTGRIPPPQLPLSLLKSLEPPITPGGTAILTRCLKPRADQRYPTAARLHADVVKHVTALDGRGPDLVPAVEEGPRRPAPGIDLIQAPTFKSAQPPPVRPPLPVPERPPRRSGTEAIRGPLLLLVSATLAFLALAAAQLGTPAPVAVPSPSGMAGVVPYRGAPADSEKREEGRRLYQQGRWAEALGILDEATTLHPDDAEAHILRENAYVRMARKPYLLIPYIGSSTGVDAAVAYSHLYGLALAQATINARGGIKGRKIVVDAYDDASSTAGCLQIAERLVRDDRVLAVVGPATSQRLLAIAPLFNSAHVNIVAPAASSEKVWEAGPYVLSASDGREPRVRALAAFVVKSGRKRIVVLQEDTSRLSDEMARSFCAAVQESGATCLEGPSYHEDPRDFGPQIDFIRKSSPDMVFLADYRAEPLARLAVQLRGAGMDVPLCAQTVPLVRDVVDLGGSSVDGVLLTDYFHPDIDTPSMRAFVAAFRRKFGDITPTYPAANTFDTLNALAQGLERADTRQGLNQALRATASFDGVGGPFALGRRLDARPIWLIQVAGGRYRLLESLQ